MSLDVGAIDRGSVDASFIELIPTQNISESPSITESIKKLFTKKLSDTVSTTESITEVKNLKKLSETPSITETLKKLLGIKVSDTLSASEYVPQYYYLGDTVAVGSLHSLSEFTSKRTGTRILSGHRIIGTPLRAITIRLKRVQLATGLLYVRIRDNNDSILAETSLESSLISSNETNYLFTITPVTMQANYRISVEYENGSLVNFIQVFGSNIGIPQYTEVFEYTNGYLEGQSYAVYGIFSP
jgi:hypothetical protein